jgi:molecular chaperone GrpE
MTKKTHEEKDGKELEETHTEMTEDKSNTNISQEQFEELTDTLKRLQAEFENYKKRQDKENLQLIRNSNAGLIKNLLPVLDSFELAIKNSNGDNQDIHKFRKGLEMIHAQFFGVLKEQGLRIIETKDKQFDPYKHDVLMVKETDGEEDMILQEFQKGYMLNDIILRHAKVMITKHKSTEEEKGEKGQSENSTEGDENG